MTTIKDFPDDLRKVAQYILDNLYRIGEESNGINLSANDYGYSAYIYTTQKNFVDVLKFRVSDHSLEGNRVHSEISLNTIEAAEDWFQKLEKKYHPERFHIEEYDYTTKDGRVLKAKRYTRKPLQKSIDMTPEDELIAIIEKELQNPCKTNLPTLCEFVKTDEGKQTATRMIFDYFLNHGVSVQTAMAYKHTKP